MNTKTKPTVALATLGCKVSQYETEALTEAFEREGFSVLGFDAAADVYVINTCTVTADADRKSRQIIRRAHKKNPSAFIMVTGCYAQSAAKEAEELEGVLYVSGNQSKMQIPKRAKELLADRACVKTECFDIQSAPFEPMCITRAPRTRAYVKIEDGCECRCSYCAIPAARGRVRSKSPEDVLREVEGLARIGTQEVVLTGIETASYGADREDGVRLSELLEMLDREAFVPRLRLGSMTPEFFKPNVIERFAKLKTLTPHIHLSVQSGSSDVLKLMRRRYLADRAMQAVKGLREAIPEIEFTADFIVGFPGESEENFEETMRFVREAEFLDLHVFAYSRRKNTPAAAFEGQIEEEVKRRRSRALIALGAEMRQKRLLRAVRRGEDVSVLFEERDGDSFLGHTPSFMPVAVKTSLDLHGEICRVGNLTSDDKCLFGTLTDDEKNKKYT